MLLQRISFSQNSMKDGKCAENKLNISSKIASLLDKGEYQCDHLQKLWITVTENHLFLITLRT